MSESKSHKCIFPNCDKSYTNKGNLKRHEITHSGIKAFKCQFENCNSEFYTNDDLKSHHISHTNNRPFKCNFENCNYAAKTKISINAHKVIHSTIKEYKCEFQDCKFETVHKSSLEGHMLQHTGEKPYQCSYPGCDHRATTSSNIRKHEITHTEIRPHKCDYLNCNYSAIDSSTLKIHKLKHLEEKPFQCNYENCNFKTIYMHSLNRHKLIHDNIKNFICDYNNCTFSTYRDDNLKLHKMIHTGEKPYKCNHKDCKFSCSNSCALKRHSRMHTGDYTCYCEQCGWPFTRKDGLNKHIKNVHSGKTTHYEKKEEKIIIELLLSNGIIFDKNVYIQFCDIENKKRAFVDIIIQTEKGIIILEIDENAHNIRNLKLENDPNYQNKIKCELDTNSYSVSCEQNRMMNIVTSLRQAGETDPIVFLRYNPNNFKFNKLKLIRSLEERSKSIINFIFDWNPKKDFEIYYYCYDEYTINNDENTRRACIWDHIDYNLILAECSYLL